MIESDRKILLSLKTYFVVLKVLIKCGHNNKSNRISFELKLIAPHLSPFIVFFLIAIMTTIQLLNKDGSTSSFEYIKRRCFNLGCHYIQSAPKTVSLIQCTGKCGITFCSTDCRHEHNENGHKFACANVKAANERNRNGTVCPKKKLEEKEEKYRIELKKCSELPEFLLKTQLMAFHQEVSIDGICKKKELVASLAQARAERWIEAMYDRKTMTQIEANEAIAWNTLLPSVFYKGESFDRRFRVGQRVLCNNRDSTPGTIVSCIFDPSFGQKHDSELFPYEIETDEGIYMNAPLDHDALIRRAEGSHVIRTEIFTDMDLIDKVKRELDSGFQYCIAARKLYGKNATSSPKLNKRRCSFCGVKANRILRVCSVCHTAAYCNSKCQKRHWKDHKEACKGVQKEKAKFLEAHPTAEKTKEGRKYIKAQSIATMRYNTLQTFFMNQCGLVFGGAHVLRNMLLSAVEHSLKDDREDALRTLATEVEDGIFALLGQCVFTSDNLLRLLAGVVHFYSIDREIAAWCVAGVDLFFQVSFNRPLVPEVSEMDLTF